MDGGVFKWNISHVDYWTNQGPQICRKKAETFVAMSHFCLTMSDSVAAEKAD